MKKLISLLLVFAMALTLVACSGGVEASIKEAEKLVAEGNYAAALEALSAADDYSKLNAQIHALRLAQLQAEKGNIIGSWIHTEGNIKLTFQDDFTGSYENLNNATQQSLDYEITADGKLYITYPSNLKLNIVQEDGITKLVNETGSTTYVTEADYEKFAPEVVELTTDNWQDYFELREALSLYTNNFGEIESFNIGYGLFLKKEYISRLKNITDVSFEIEADRAYRAVELDEATGDYTLGEYYDYNWEWHYEGQHGTFSSSVWDRTYNSDDPRSDTYMQVCGIVSDGGYTTVNDVRYYSILEKGVLSRIQGTLELSK